MKNIDNVHSKRYYIFKHDPTNTAADTVRYREATGSWYADFDKANLWADHAFAIKKAKELQAQLRGCEATEKFIVCIGQVDIAVNGFFAIEVADKQ